MEERASEKSYTVELLYSTLPYSDQIVDLDLDSETEAFRFTWRGVRFRVSNTRSVEEIRDIFLSGSNAAILMKELLNREHIRRATK